MLGNVYIMIKYRTNRGTEITKHEVVKETNSRITYIKIWHSWRSNEDESRQETENKVASWHSWHNTFEEAQNFLIELHNNKIEGLKKQIEYTNGQIEKVRSLNVA